MAGNPSWSWARVDPSIYAQCFTGQAMSAENWCAKCLCLDHTSSSCPYRQKKRPWNAAFGTGSTQLPARSGMDTPVCIKYNNFNGDCKFGKECRFLHVCSSCKGHPVTPYTRNTNGVAPAPGQGQLHRPGNEDRKRTAEKKKGKK